MKNTLFLIVTAFSAIVWAQGAPQGAQITNVLINGPGCRNATASATLSPDSTELSILFDNLILETNASNVNQKNLRAETSCTVTVDFQIPQGWQMALTGVDYRGFAAIPAEAQGYQRFLYQVSSMPAVSMREATFRGPFNDNYTFSAAQKPGRAAWTPCGSSAIRLPMTAVIGVAYQRRGYYPAATVALDSQDLSLSQDFQVAWQRCN